MFGNINILGYERNYISLYVLFLNGKLYFLSKFQTQEMKKWLSFFTWSWCFIQQTKRAIVFVCVFFFFGSISVCLCRVLILQVDGPSFWVLVCRLKSVMEWACSVFHAESCGMGNARCLYCCSFDDTWYAVLLLWVSSDSSWYELTETALNIFFFFHLVVFESNQSKTATVLVTLQCGELAGSQGRAFHMGQNSQW